MNAPLLHEGADGKAPEALRTIGEVAKALGIKQHVLRYWEEQFPALRPLTRAGGRRYYRAQDIALIAEIDRLLHREGYTIKGARQALRRRKVDVAAPVVAPQPERSAQGESAAPLIAFLRGIRDRLATALDE
ncbi:MAG: MerR family transcriptional regulator [Novosphingobium meiothermophilum]